MLARVACVGGGVVVAVVTVLSTLSVDQLQVDSILSDGIGRHC